MVVMGFRVTIFLWFVLLISERNVCFAAQTLLLPGFNDTLNQTPREQMTSAQQGTHPSPVTVRLRTYQLRNTVALPNKQSLPGSAEETMQTPKNLLEAEAMLPSVLLQQRKNVQDQDLAQGPNLSLSSPDPGRKGSKVAWARLIFFTTPQHFSPNNINQSDGCCRWCWSPNSQSVHQQRVCQSAVVKIRSL